MLKTYITNYDLDGQRLNQGDYIFSDTDISSVTEKEVTLEEALDLCKSGYYHSTYEMTKIKAKYKGFGKNKKLLYRYFDARSLLLDGGIKITDEKPLIYRIEVKECSFPSISYIMKHYSADKAISILTQLGAESDIIKAIISK